MKHEAIPVPALVRLQAAKSRSQVRRLKVGRLEPGDLWGMQHMQAGADAEVEIVAVESCEVGCKCCLSAYCSNHSAVTRPHSSRV